MDENRPRELERKAAAALAEVFAPDEADDLAYRLDRIGQLAEEIVAPVLRAVYRTSSLEELTSLLIEEEERVRLLCGYWAQLVGRLREVGVWTLPIPPPFDDDFPPLDSQ